VFTKINKAGKKTAVNKPKKPKSCVCIISSLNKDKYPTIVKIQGVDNKRILKLQLVALTEQVGLIGAATSQTKILIQCP
jgi:hypothetical protein